MKESLKNSIKAVLMLVVLFASIVTASGAISLGTQESALYIVAAVISLCATAYGIYREIKRN